MDVQGQPSNFYWCQGQAKISTSLYNKCFLHRHEYHQVQGRDSMCHRLFNGLMPRIYSTLSTLCCTTPSKSLHVYMPQFPHLRNSCNIYCIRAITWGCCHVDKWLRDPWIDADLAYKHIYKWRCILLLWILRITGCLHYQFNVHEDSIKAV